MIGEMSETLKNPPCRLFIITAQKAPVALILRRGPAAWYHVILWNMSRDSFEHGSWIRGRIYEEKCDLSPDGKLFVYFILQGNRARSAYTHAWTAVSRPPWLTALALWPQGTTYGGGGRFTDNRRLVVRTGDPPVPHPEHPGRGLKVIGGSPSKIVSATHDHRGRNIYARSGKLYRCVDGREVELADFNGLRPDPQPPPALAHRVPR